MIIRDATELDLPGIAKVKVDTWRTAYKGLISDEILNNLDYEQQAIQFTKLLPKDNSNILIVAEEKGIIGFSSGGEEREKKYGFECEVYAIYVLKEHQNKGIGKQLFRESLKRLSKSGYKSVLVWVLEGNPYRRFYEALGGELVDRKPLDNTELFLVAYGWKDISKILEKRV